MLNLSSRLLLVWKVHECGHDLRNIDGDTFKGTQGFLTISREFITAIPGPDVNDHRTNCMAVTQIIDRGQQFKSGKIVADAVGKNLRQVSSLRSLYSFDINSSLESTRNITEFALFNSLGKVEFSTLTSVHLRISIQFSSQKKRTSGVVQFRITRARLHSKDTTKGLLGLCENWMQIDDSITR